MTRRAACLVACVVLGGAVACGSFSSTDAGDSDAGGADASPADEAAVVDSALRDDRGASDAETDTARPPCNLASPWGLPAQIVASAATNTAITLSEDELTAFYDKLVPNGGTGRYTIFVTTRAKVGDIFPIGGEIALPIQSASDTDTPSLTQDGRTLFFTSNRSGTGYHLWYSERTNVASTFMPPGSPDVLIGSASASDVDPFSDSAGDVWFSSNRSGTYDILVAARSADGGLGVPAPVPELNSPASERAPIVSRDGLTVYFTSGRTGSMAQDVWTATRATTSTMFGTPVVVSEVSSVANDTPRWLSPDGCRLYISSDRSGSPRILVSSRGN